MSRSVFNLLYYLFSRREVYLEVSLCLSSSCTLVGKAAHSPAQNCHQHPSGTRASKVHEFGAFFFSSFHQQGGNPAGTFPHYIFHWRQVSLVMQETDMKARLISALPSTLGSTVSQRKEKRDFCFPTPDFPSPFCCSHWHCANPRIHIHHLKRQLKKSRTCKCGPLKKKDKKSCWNIPEWPSSTAEPHHHGNSVLMEPFSKTWFPDLPRCHTGNHS